MQPWEETRAKPGGKNQTSRAYSSPLLVNAIWNPGFCAATTPQRMLKVKKLRDAIFDARLLWWAEGLSYQIQKELCTKHQLNVLGKEIVCKLQPASISSSNSPESLASLCTGMGVCLGEGSRARGIALGCSYSLFDPLPEG